MFTLVGRALATYIRTKMLEHVDYWLDPLVVFFGCILG
jgi:hypothetical protein